MDGIIAKIKNQEPIDEMEAITQLLSKQDSEEDMSIMTDAADHFFNYIFECYRNNLSSDKVPYYMIVVIQKMSSTTPDGSFFLSKIFKYLEFWKVIGENPKRLSTSDDWKSCCGLMMSPFAINASKISKFNAEIIKTFIGILKIETYGTQVYAMFAQINANSPRALVPHAEALARAIPDLPSICGLLEQAYNSNPQPFHDMMPNILEAFINADIGAKLSVITFIWQVSKKSPRSIEVFMTNPEFRESLFSPMSGTMVGMVVREVATVDATLIVDWLGDLMEAFNSNQNLAYVVAGSVAMIGRISEEYANKVVPMLFAVLKQNTSNVVVSPQFISGLKNVQDKYKACLLPFIDEIKVIVSNTTETSVRNIGQNIIDVAEARDLQTISKQVSENTKDITDVKTTVVEQNTKIENVEKTVVETKQEVATIRKDVDDTKQEIQTVTQKVDEIDTRVTTTEKQINVIMDKFDEMNQKVLDSCKSTEELKEYIDQNVAMLKEFIADVVKKLPNPYNFTAEGVIRRTLTLYFECDRKNDGCMYTRDTPYKTDTSDWAKWLKMSFTLCKLGKSLYDKSFLDAYGAVNELYNQYKQKEDQNFTSYISQPFLTSTEQDSLIEQLRDQRFFDLFTYNAQTASWYCVKCHKHEHQPPIKTLNESDINSNGEPANPNSTSTLPTADPNIKLENYIKMSVGLMKRITKVWCILETDKVMMYTKDKKSVKHVLSRSGIVDIKDLDTRVTKRENSFSIITRDRTYQACAATPEIKEAWKKALMP